MKTTKTLKYYEAIGRRKESVALVRLYIVGKDKTAVVKENKILAGEMLINGKKIEAVFPRATEKNKYQQPLILTNNLDRFAISIKTQGGGQNGQLQAIIHGISRALVLADPETYKPLLSAEGLLTRDPRAKERRKVGTGGRARHQKQSPKR